MSVLATPNFLRSVVSLLYPAACTICSTSVESGQFLCPDCESKLGRIVPPFCEKCSEPFDGAITTTFACANCAHRDLRFNAAVSAFRSRGVVRQVVLNFKYGKQIHLRHLIAQWLLVAMDDPRIRGRHFDLLVPVPLHSARQRERGFNQAEILAECVGNRLNIPCRSILERTHYTTTQTAFDRAERMRNLRGAFRLRRNRDVRKSHVLLIDDVLTTGSTLSECARVLKKAGAATVYAITAARA